MKLSQLNFVKICILSIMILFTLNSCNTLKSLMGKPAQTEIVYDTVFVKVNDGGKFEEVLPGGSFRPTKRVVLSDDFDYAEFNANDKVQLIIDGIDFCSSTIKVTKDDDENKVSIQVLPIKNGEVVLSQKCQVQNWYDPYELPVIKLDDLENNSRNKRNDPQIVITPIYNSDCEKIGYQIRYGSTNRGCGQVAKSVLNQYSKCNGNPPRTRKSKPKLKDIVGDSDDFLWGTLPKSN